MSNNRIRWDGLDEFRRELRNLPETLTLEASRIVEGAANGAAADIRGAYPVRSGGLQQRLVVTHFDKGKYSAGAIVKNTSPHSHLFEFGTAARHTAIGANRGKMPPGNVFVPRIERARRRMYDRLKSLLERNGLRVSGDA